MDFDLDVHNYGPFSVKGVLFYLKSAYEIWSIRPIQVAMSVIGTLAFARFTTNLLSFLTVFALPSKVQSYCHSETGSWVLITGATDGIGYSFADVFLERGFNVLLHGRNPKKLDKVRKELAAKYPRRSLDVVVADASLSDQGFQKVADKARQLPGKLTVLVNNVGGAVGKRQFATHGEATQEDLDTVLNVNIRFPTQLTRAVIPLLRQNGPALILNCGSLAGNTGMPFLVNYGGTKAYVHQFTEALKAEFDLDREARVEVMGFLIGNVRTAGNQTETAGLTITSRKCVEGCLARVGNGRALNYSDFVTGAADGVLSALPSSVYKNFVSQEMQKRREKELKEL